MHRRVLMIVPLAICFAADPARESADVIAGLAAALAAGNAQEFLASFDRRMPDYGQLETNIRALVLQADVQSYVDVGTNEGDEKARKLEIDWTLRIQRTGDATPLPDREARITCRLEKQGKNWRIVAFDRVAFFAPAP
jgi:hypothetical protein